MKLTGEQEEAATLILSSIEKLLNRLDEIARNQDRIMDNCTRNLQKLEDALKYIRGVEAQVRPMAKRNDWYNEELTVPEKITSSSTLNPKRPIC